jgi:hypothetical protein
MISLLPLPRRRIPAVYLIVPMFLVGSLVSGCQSPRTARIAENPAVYRTLDPYSRNLVRQGLVNFGFSADAVYLAMGRPDRITTAHTDEGTMETWIYRNVLYTRPQAVRSVANPQLVDINMPLATQFITLRDHRVIGIRIEP